MLPGHLPRARNVTVVLKGERTLIGFPDGGVWINPTGLPPWPPEAPATF